MSQNETQKENSQKSVTLSQNGRSSQVEIALSQASQYEVSVSAASGQVTVLSSGPANVAVHGQVIVSQGQSQDRVTFKVNGSQGSFVASQAQVAPQENVSTQDSSSQAAVPTLSQFSQTSPSLSQGLAQSQKQSQYAEKENIQKLETIPESVSRTSSQNSHDLNKSCWSLGQSNSPGRDVLANCSQNVLNDGKNNQTKNDE